MVARLIERLARNERGGIVALVAVCLVVILGMAGLALDAGWAYIRKAELSRAVDAGVLAAARAARLGEDVAEDHAEALAAANGVVRGVNGISYGLRFGSNDDGEFLVGMEATRPVPTLLMRVLGFQKVDVKSVAVAAVPPVDMVLVLDQSGSLGWADCGAGPGLKAWDCLQTSAKRFVFNFADHLDQLGLVSFQLRATHRFHISGDFTEPIQREIDLMEANGDTNAGEGLRLAYEQFQSPMVRERSTKVVVFFTDGRPTAMRGDIGGQDRMIAVYQNLANRRMRGYFNDPESLPTDRIAIPDGCRNNPINRPCFGWTEPTIREESRVVATGIANEIRDAGFLLYTVGLGNPDDPDPLVQPDLDWLQFIANEDGIANPSQPKGKSYFAENASVLDEVFSQLAQDLIVRLAL